MTNSYTVKRTLLDFCVIGKYAEMYRYVSDIYIFRGTNCIKQLKTEFTAGLL